MANASSEPVYVELEQLEPQPEGMTELERELVQRGWVPYVTPDGGQGWGEPFRDRPEPSEMSAAGYAAWTLCAIAFMTFLLVLLKGWPA